MNMRSGRVVLKLEAIDVTDDVMGGDTLWLG